MLADVGAGLGLEMGGARWFAMIDGLCGSRWGRGVLVAPSDIQ